MPTTTPPTGDRRGRVVFLGHLEGFFDPFASAFSEPRPKYRRDILKALKSIPRESVLLLMMLYSADVRINLTPSANYRLKSENDILIRHGYTYTEPEIVSSVVVSGEIAFSFKQPCSPRKVFTSRKQFGLQEERGE